MRALRWDGRQARVMEQADPAPCADRALVRVALAGICRTDLEILRGYMGFRGVLGHEFVGTVEAGPSGASGASGWQGARVVGEINFACGACDWCTQGLGRHCPGRTVMGIQGADGAFAERVAVPVANLHRVPDAVPDEAAVFTEPLAAAFEILEQVEVGPGQRCVVLGDGKLGLLVAQVLAGTGASVLAVGRHAEKLALLASRDVETVLERDWDGAAADLVVEATGRAEGFARAVAATRPRGTLVLKSTLAEAAPLNVAPLVIHEITLVGSRCGPFEPALAALADGRVSVEPLIEARCPLDDGVAALERAGAPGARKLLLDCT